MSRDIGGAKRTIFIYPLLSVDPCNAIRYQIHVNHSRSWRLPSMRLTRNALAPILGVILSLPFIGIFIEVNGRKWMYRSCNEGDTPLIHPQTDYTVCHAVELGRSIVV